jgi:excisionase family DNA binding protein
MSPSESRFLTTSEAAVLCSVQPDTVLKWVKKGRLRAVKTAGGHNRIQYRDLEAFLRTRRGGFGTQSTDQVVARPVRCWEFFGNQGILREGCKRCPVYRVRASFCFEMRGMGDVDYPKLFCQNSCEDCAYYQRVKGLKIHVLVITQDRDLTELLAGEESSNLSLRVVHNVYEASAAIHDFRPAFAVVDHDLFRDSCQELTGLLTSDPRVPGLRVVLAVSAARRGRRKNLDTGAVAVLVKPFGLDLLTDVVQGQPVESAVDESSRKS